MAVTSQDLGATHGHVLTVRAELRSDRDEDDYESFGAGVWANHVGTHTWICRLSKALGAGATKRATYHAPRKRAEMK